MSPIDSDEFRFSLLSLLQSTTGKDFSPYRWELFRDSLSRKIHELSLSPSQYLLHLQEKKAAVDELKEEVLVGVTSFLRDPEVFFALAAHLKSELLPLKSPGETIHIWVPGVSTGEEAYTLAFLLDELLSNHHEELDFSILGTDINEPAIRAAQEGHYRRKSIEKLPQAWQEHYFLLREEDQVEICPSIKERVRFLVHDLLLPPPELPVLDLISCRNVLIYFRSPFRKATLRLFARHLANHHSYLLLGISEGVTAASDCFVLLDGDHRIFSRRVETPSGSFQIVEE